MSKLTKIQKVVLAAVMAIAVAVPVAIAQSTDSGAQKGRGHWGEQGRRGGADMMGFRNLDLSDAQKAQMKQIRDSHSQSLRPVMDQIRAKRQEIRQASEGGSFNEALVTQKLTEIAPLEAKLQGDQFRLHQEMIAVLTPEQKAKLDQQRAEFKAKWAERHTSKQKSN
ncbi:MAG TPA: Spy/CpxP family protein refolding chaperone [Blastocatellia bacterium]|nr:Spy/CpxP family protein refolding chaperone [Blastocatellia bacterium]